MRVPVAMWAILLLATPVVAEEYKVQSVKEKAPEASLSPEVSKELSESGIRVMEGDEAICTLWLTKTWPAKADFTASADHLYPFLEGQLMGVLNFAGKGSDFRDQPLRKGTYTLRYSLQPQDGNHVGTSDTRDFFLVIKAADDKDPAPIKSQEALFQKAAKAAGSTHPAMLSLKRVIKKAEELPAIRHDEEHDLWILQFSGTSQIGDKATPTVLELVILGHAAE